MERTRYGSIVVVGFLLGWVALATSPANAQTSRDQVWTQLQSAYTVAAEDGYKQLNYIIGWLNNGSEPDLNWPLSLVAGSHYLLAGACDNDCTDFDLTIEDGDRAVLASDTEVDDIPMVSFTPSANATYWVKPTMATCSVEPCGYGIAVFVQ